MYKTCEGWASYPYAHGMDQIYIYGDLYLQNLLNKVNNQFWKATIKSLLLLYNKNTFHGTEAMLATPLWYNSKIITGRISSWSEKGILTIGDILGMDGELRSAENIKMTWKVKCDFLLHMRLKNKIKLIFQHKNRSNENIHPQMSHLLYGIDICNRGNKNTYINIMGKDHFSVDAIKDKWCERLNDEISINTIQNAFKNTKNYASSAYQYYNQLYYNLLQR